MKFPEPIPIRTIAQQIQAEIVGDDTLLATGLNEISKVEPGDITFVFAQNQHKRVLASKATIAIASEPVPCPVGKALLICPEPFKAYNALALFYKPRQVMEESISAQATIHPSTIIEPGVKIGADVTIGANCYIQANVVIHNQVVIGNEVTIQAGAVIGSDAFYFRRTRKEPDYTPWHSAGRVVLKDRVHIGPLANISRGVSGDTVIGENTKIDGQTYIAHDTVIGRNCMICAQVAIAGSVVIEDDVIVYGQSGVVANVSIGSGATIAGQSGVVKSLEGGHLYGGCPAEQIG